MKQTHTPGDIADNWNADAIYAKAERYVQKMQTTEVDSWEYALWSSLSLELLARAALANVNPVLLAETGKNWDSLYQSLGYTPKAERFSPKSISTNEVVSRLRSIFEGFTTDDEKFCIRHTGKRNSELHSGEAAFEGVDKANWQAEFYVTCSSMLATMDMSLADFIGAEEAAVAEKIIAAWTDSSAKAVLGDVEAYRKVWNDKDAGEREGLVAAAKAWASRQWGHRVNCPACTTVALVQGEAVSDPTQSLKDDEITETQHYLPNQLECIACGLKVSGLSKLTAVGLADRYKKTQVYDAAEFYAPEDEWGDYEPDNNER
ncbi:MAG: hypothetical protein ACRBM6_09630 [Geminicoccales bacterium]